MLKLVPTFEQRSRKYARPVGRAFRVDETYDPRSRAAGCILYRAMDKAGQTVDFYLSEHRDVLAVKRFFRRAMLRSELRSKSRWTGIKPRIGPLRS